MATASSAFKIKCPSCEATVTIRDPNLAGKKIDCPKCKYRFVAEPPDENAEGEGSAAPAGADKAKANGTAKKSKNKPLPKADDGEGDEKKKKKKSKGLNKTLLIGGGLGVIAIAVLVIGYFAGLFDSGDSGGGNNNGGNNQSKDSPPKDAPGKDGMAKGPGGMPNPGNTKGPGGLNPNNPGGLNPGGNNPQPKQDPPVDPTKDITNMLPEDSQWVMKVNGREFIETPVGGVFFEPSGDAAGAFKRWMGFAGDDVENSCAPAASIRRGFSASSA